MLSTVIFFTLLPPLLLVLVLLGLITVNKLPYQLNGVPILEPLPFKFSLSLAAGYWMSHLFAANASPYIGFCIAIGSTLISLLELLIFDRSLRQKNSPEQNQERKQRQRSRVLFLRFVAAVFTTVQGPFLAFEFIASHCSFDSALGDTFCWMAAAGYWVFIILSLFWTLSFLTLLAAPREVAPTPLSQPISNPRGLSTWIGERSADCRSFFSRENSIRLPNTDGKNLAASIWVRFQAVPAKARDTLHSAVRYLEGNRRICLSDGGNTPLSTSGSATPRGTGNLSPETPASPLPTEQVSHNNPPCGEQDSRKTPEESRQSFESDRTAIAPEENVGEKQPSSPFDAPSSPVVSSPTQAESQTTADSEEEACGKPKNVPFWITRFSLRLARMVIPIWIVTAARATLYAGVPLSVVLFVLAAVDGCFWRRSEEVNSKGSTTGTTLRIILNIFALISSLTMAILIWVLTLAPACSYHWEYDHLCSVNIHAVLASFALAGFWGLEIWTFSLWGTAMDRNTNSQTRTSRLGGIDHESYLAVRAALAPGEMLVIKGV